MKKKIIYNYPSFILALIGIIILESVNWKVALGTIILFFSYHWDERSKK